MTETALRTAKAVVVLWSKKSVQSRWVRAEATLADRNKTLLPCMIEPCERPIMFELTQTAELGHWTGDPGDRVWVSFLGDVKRFLERASSAAPMQGPGPQIDARPTIKERLPSIAVLPFTNRSGLAEDDFFAEAMVEDVISALSQGANVRVLGGLATAHLRKGAFTDLAALGRQLDVSYLLEGNVRRMGPNLRVTSQLVEATGGAILWMQKFDRPLSQIGELQEELVLDVARALGAEIQRIEIERALKKPDDLNLWEAATRSMMEMTRGNYHAALAEAEKALRMTPEHGGAHAALAQALSGMIFWEVSDDPVWDKRAREHVARALQLAPRNSNVLARCARALTWSGHPADAVGLCRQAIALKPAAVHPRIAYAQTLFYLQSVDEALAEFAIALELGSHPIARYAIFWWRTASHLKFRHFDAAIEGARETSLVMPNQPLSLWLHAVTAGVCGEDQEAKAAMKLLRDIEADAPLAKHMRRIERLFAGNSVSAAATEAFARIWGASDAEKNETDG